MHALMSQLPLTGHVSCGNRSRWPVPFTKIFSNSVQKHNPADDEHLQRVIMTVSAAGLAVESGLIVLNSFWAWLSDSNF